MKTAREGTKKGHPVPSIKELREAFASDQSNDLVDKRADELAPIAGPGFTRLPLSRKLTTRAVWYEHADALMAVVGDQERGDTDHVLAHGLHLADGRALRLVLPALWARPTRHRVPWLTSDIQVFTYEPGQDPIPDRALDQEQTRQKAGHPERSPSPHLGPAAEWVRDLIEWATANTALDASHTKAERGWSCQGQRVLRVKGRRRLTIIAGIDAASEKAHSVPVTAPLSDQQLAELKGHVEAGIANARDNKFGAFEEHNLQGILRREPGLLRLEHPLLRELPAWRPAGGEKPLGRGYID